MTRFSGRQTAALVLFLLLASPFPAPGEETGGFVGWDEEFTFDAREFEKSPLELGGFVQMEASHSRFREDSSQYLLSFFDQDQDSSRDLFGVTLQPDLNWQAGPVRIFSMASLQGTASEEDQEDEYTLLEGYASWQAAPGVSFSAGKTLARWGKGYAFSPVAFISREKNPSDPDLAMEGFWMAIADLVWSFPGSMRTLAFTGAAFPVDEDINDNFGQEESWNWAGKLYLLWHDTDIDFMVLSEGARTFRFGADFSRNLSTNFEIHGEWALVEDSFKRILAPDYSLESETDDAQSWLLGIRYLTAAETTYIVEYYRNGQGYTEGEAEVFYTLVEGATETELAQLREISGPYQKPNFMRDYLYLRASQKEPFGWLYFTPALTSILNVNDGSFNLIPEIIYTGVTNLELRFRINLLAGDGGTEYGEKPNRWKTEARARYFF